MASQIEDLNYILGPQTEHQESKENPDCKLDYFQHPSADCFDFFFEKLMFWHYEFLSICFSGLFGDFHNNLNASWESRISTIYTGWDP